MKAYYYEGPTGVGRLRIAANDDGTATAQHRIQGEVVWEREYKNLSNAKRGIKNFCYGEMPNLLYVKEKCYI